MGADATPAAVEASVIEVLKRLTTSDSLADRSSAAVDIASLIRSHDVLALKKYNVLSTLTAAIEDEKSPSSREGALLAVAQLCALGPVAEAFLLPLLPACFARINDKAPTVRTAAEAAAAAITDAVSPCAVPCLVPLLLAVMQDRTTKFPPRVTAANMLTRAARVHAPAMSGLAPQLLPILVSLLDDVRPEVATANEGALTAVCSTISNKDIEKFIPALVSSMVRPSEVPECVHKLSATTFVAAVEPPALALMVPLLERGLKDRTTAIKRKCAVIIDNMTKLVAEPEWAAPFVPRLLPGLEIAIRDTSDPECRDVAKRAHATLLSASGLTEESAASLMIALGVQAVPKGQDAAAIKASGAAVVARLLRTAVPKDLAAMLTAFVVEAKIAGFAPADPFTVAAVAHIAAMSAALVDRNHFAASAWAFGPYLAPFVGGEAAADAIILSLRKKCEELERKARGSDFSEELEAGDELCACEFSLAYGGKILLNSAKLRMIRGMRYGLCGHNGCGKSTLMRAIANGQLEGFPSPDVVRTFYVEHDIDGTTAEIDVTSFVLSTPGLPAGTTKDTVQAELRLLGFSEVMLVAPITSLSGGWRVKLALARAMVYKADIMLLDEPTNHMDVKNVAWLVDYLNGLKHVTSMIVSHDSSFLDKVCTHIIHYERFKLKVYRGNLSVFVKSVPEAKAYYSLDDSQFKFTFPEPGFLDGVKTKEKAIMKMLNVSFTYPNTERQIIRNLTCYLSLASRIGIVGPNGAGKSTLIKVLTGELEATSGAVYRHPNLRFAYIAQHAFHHIDDHLDKTPAEYIMWRFATGEDREAQRKAVRQMTEEEEKALLKAFTFPGPDGKPIKLVLKEVMSRRKLKAGFEYEVSWVGQSADKNSWMPRQAIEAGDPAFGKMLDAYDAKMAAQEGSVATPLTQANIAKHLAQLGLEQEFTLHSRIRGLSGGQKVKVVIGAATWNHPQIIILDEPTNYLDRDSLGALAGAIKEFTGGVALISHNAPFVSHCCSEMWTLQDGNFTVEGGSGGTGEKVLVTAGPDEVVDAAGNVIKVKQVGVVKKARGRKARLAALAGEDEDEE